MESNERSIIPRRVAGVGVALASTGAVLGAGLSAGLAALAGFGLRAGGIAIPGGSVLTAAGVGAALGAVLTPMTALSLLRRVALGKALLVTMLGMATGVAAAEVSTGQSIIAAGAGFGAFLLAALVLRLTSGPRRQASKRKAPSE
jgi:hypothetical protein